jgi:hypothetical protein
MVHGGPRAGVQLGLTGELTARAPTKRGGRGESHRRNRGWRGGLMRPGDDETKRRRTELGATANGTRRSGEKESAR